MYGLHWNGMAVYPTVTTQESSGAVALCKDHHYILPILETKTFSVPIPQQCSSPGLHLSAPTPHPI